MDAHKPPRVYGGHTGGYPHCKCHTATHTQKQNIQLCGLLDDTLVPDWWGKSVNWISHAYTVSTVCVSVSVRACVSAGCRLKRHSLSQHHHSLLGCEASSCRTLMFGKSCKMYFSPPYLVIPTRRGTDNKHTHVRVTHLCERGCCSWLSRCWAGCLSHVSPCQPPLSDMLPEWTWHRRLTGAKWAMSNDRGHPAHWLIVLNNEPGSPLWLVLEVGGWQLADLSTAHSTPSLKWICRMAAGVAGVKPPFFHPPTATHSISPRRRLLSYCAVQEYPSETAFVSGLASVDLQSQA